MEKNRSCCRGSKEMPSAQDKETALGFVQSNAALPQVSLRIFKHVVNLQDALKTCEAAWSGALVKFPIAPLLPKKVLGELSLAERMGSREDIFSRSTASKLANMTESTFNIY